MSNMTGFGRYQKALELEAEGLAANQVAYKAGYKNTQAWYDAKYRYKKQTDEMNQRAKGNDTAPAPDPLLAEIGQVKLPHEHNIGYTYLLEDAQPLINTVRTCPEKTPTLKINTEIKAEGKCLRYRLQNGELLIACLKGDRSIRIPLSDVPGLIAELQELMAIGGMA